uniref:N-terminal kinase-like protein n=1 Tax=Panagrellus redivivus TaxID=6233 RepID=A0A7E4VMP5_PANRE
MASVLSSFFSRDPRSAFPYEKPGEPFCVFNGLSMGDSFKKAEPNEKATVAWASGPTAQRLRTQAQKLKTLRHPGIVAFYDSLEHEDTFYLVTEPAKPLRVYFEETKLKPGQKELIVSWGLFQVMNTLKFLHNEAKITHSGIKDAIFVTASGDWKLGCFEQTQPFSSSKTDLNALAIVIWQIFNGFNNEISEPKAPGKVPARLIPLYKKLASRGAEYAAGDLLSECRARDGFMKNKFVDTLLFLEEFQLKESSEKHAFFMHLKDSLDMFPDDLAKYKILPKLIHTYEYGDAGAHILIPMFKLGRLLDEDEYQHRIVPCLVKLFSSPDRTTRVKLLEKIDDFAPHLKPNVVNEKIYSNLVTGFLDTNPAVRESTVKAMVPLAEKLNYHNLNVDLMKYLARLQGADDQPGIRTNTTICLGKIGCYIDPSQRQKILISAFTRALKDPFPPARMSGVLAIGATQQYYSLVEVANRILPVLSPLTMDPEKQVREQGFKALRGFLEKLEKASENPAIIPELEAQVLAGGRSGLLSGDKVPAWAGWALKAIGGKFYKSTGPEAAAAVTTEQNPESGVPVKKPIAKPAPKVHTVVDDGWGEIEDTADEEDADDGSGAEAWTSKAKKMETAPAATTGGGWDVDESKDDDDWSTEWEKPAPKPAVVKPAVKKPILGGGAAGKKIGGLKLSHHAPKSAFEDDLDAILGGGATKTSTPSPHSSRGSTPANVKPPAPASVSSGWDDAGGDDDNWGSGSDWNEPIEEKKPAAPAPSSSNNEARRAAIAARNEARRKELAAKKAARGLGAMKLGGTSKGE